MKERLLNTLYNFWKKNNNEEYNKTLKEQLNDAIYKNGLKGADTLLDWCRDSYVEYYEKEGITQEELKEHNGDVDCGELDNIWDICNWYLDYLNATNVEEIHKYERLIEEYCIGIDLHNELEEV